MRKWIFITVLTLITGCRQKEAESWLTQEKATAYFNTIGEICKKDGGKLWGKDLSGPVMFVDRASRKIVANMPDNDGLLKYRDGIYTGLYPGEKIIFTTALEYGGTLFGLAPLPVEEDDFRVRTRALHSLFHRFQKLSGIDTAVFNLTNMDDKEARIWIKLEWRALKKAISTEGEEQMLAIRDALIFRGSNREAYPKYADLENQFETYEGLATFTYLLLGTDSDEAYRTRLFESLDRIYTFQSYARSYGVIHGALYATLLHNKGFDFTSIKTDRTDLGLLVKEIYNIELPKVCRDVAGSIGISYGVDEILNEEEKRLTAMRESINEEVRVFTERPVVFFELESPSFDFEPEDVHSLDTLGTLYYSMRVMDNWGKLTVDKNGCLVLNNYRQLRIPARGLRVKNDHIYGDGWHLILKEGWEVAEMEQNYIVRKVIP